MYSYMYSMTSLLGVAVLLICTPLGLARIFSVIGAIVMKPQVCYRHPQSLCRSVFFDIMVGGAHDNNDRDLFVLSLYTYFVILCEEYS